MQDVLIAELAAFAQPEWTVLGAPEAQVRPARGDRGDPVWEAWQPTPAAPLTTFRCTAAASPSELAADRWAFPEAGGEPGAVVPGVPVAVWRGEAAEDQGEELLLRNDQKESERNPSSRD